MAYSTIGLPLDGVGKALAARKAVAAGPSSEDLYFEINVSQPDNSVGRILGVQQLSALPTVLTVVSAVDIALETLFLNNVTGAAIAIHVVSGDGVDIIPDGFLLPSFEVINLDLKGITVVGGIKWKAASVGVNGAIKYYKAA